MPPASGPVKGPVAMNAKSSSMNASYRPALRERLGIKLWRLARWEFWPMWAFYPPIVVYIFTRAALGTKFMAVTAVNPCLKASGIVGETKHDALDPLQANAPQYVGQFTPLPAIAPLGERLQCLRQFVNAGAGYPIVLKPDIGQRGRGVAVIRSETQASDYLAAAQDDVIAQRYIDGVEFGVFVYRDPKTGRVELLSIVRKCFPSVTGDGTRSLAELIRDDARARLIAPGLWKRFADRLTEIPAAGAVIPLVEIGAHSRGSLFLDGADLKSEALRQTMSAILDAVPGYHFGRIDLRCPSEAHLRDGVGLKVMEMNGVTAESAHIYNPGTPLLEGWKTMIDQWKLAIEIGEANVAKGASTISFVELLKLWRADNERGERWF